MSLDDFKSRLTTDLDRQLVSSRVLLQRFVFIDESSRRTAAYTDPRFTPFYYHLGKYVQPKKLLCVGLRLGLLPGCFLKSCKSVENILAIESQKDAYFSPRLGLKNIRQNFKGDLRFKTNSWEVPSDKTPFNDDVWDVTIVDEELDYDICRIVLDKIWENTVEGGLIVMDYLESTKPNGRAFRDFAKIHNRESVEFNTRYKVGVVEK